MEAWKEKRKNAANCQIQADGFYFPKGYYFKQGMLKRQKSLPFHQIREIRVNTHPITAITHSKEVIFLKGLKREDIYDWENKQQIPLIAPQDNWALICDEFLDTEYSPEEQARTLERLAEKGIGEAEVAQIRKRLKTRMLIRTYVSWEWMYYGQFEVLTELWPLNQKKYKWTMDVALRKKE
ncbi:MAG: hypothetical protein AAF696_06810 [Bacteroidota bacterium]